MGLFENFLSAIFDSSSNLSPDDRYVNIDGTPMMDNHVDINGDPFGSPSGLNSSDDFMNSTSGFSSFNDDW